MEQIKKYKEKYTQVSNKVLNDNRLSLKAKGIYAYLYSKVDGWQFHYGAMKKELKESEDSIRNTLKELEQYGYIIKYQYKDEETKKFGGTIIEFIDPDLTEQENSVDVKIRTGKIPARENTGSNNTNNINNTDILNNTNIDKKINKKEYEEHFIECWDNYPKQRIGSKEKAYKSYLKVIKEKRIEKDALLEKIKEYAESEEVSRGYAKGFSAWLNDDRFNCQYKKQENSFDEEFIF